MVIKDTTTSASTVSNTCNTVTMTTSTPPNSKSLSDMYLLNLASTQVSPLLFFILSPDLLFSHKICLGNWHLCHSLDFGTSSSLFLSLSLSLSLSVTVSASVSLSLLLSSWFQTEKAGENSKVSNTKRYDLKLDSGYRLSSPQADQSITLTQVNRCNITHHRKIIGYSKNHHSCVRSYLKGQKVL